jgi:hypothetical protein
MNFLPFLPRLESMAILEAEYEGEAARAELEAEIGSGFFMDCRDSYQASWMAREQIEAMQQDFESTPEGALHMARVEAARFMQSATRGLDVVGADDLADPRIFTPVGAPLIREFFPGRRYNVTVPAPAEDDIPF